MSKGSDMRIGQDLCIALVLAVIGVGLGSREPARADARDSLAAVEGAIVANGLSEDEAASVRSLIEDARAREQAGDEDGAASAMAEASALLRIS